LETIKLNDEINIAAGSLELEGGKKSRQAKQLKRKFTWRNWF